MHYFCGIDIGMIMDTFAGRLMEWYEVNKRDLPWRETKDPYRIWISEIILQQTRVAQGYDYFMRFIRRFPDVRTLAEADEDEVMRYWQGLGYYSRARNLHAAAQSMNGVFPRTYAGVRALKGVGDYTAAAICSLAYGMPYAVVDGNVYRVLSRYFDIDVPIDSAEGKKVFAGLAQELVDKKHADVYNQAIMDFGALQCVPQSPVCSACPLADTCLALARGRVSVLPVKRHKTKVTDRYFIYIYVCAGREMLLAKRTGNDIWRNLYELPLLEADSPLEELEVWHLLQDKGWVSVCGEGMSFIPLRRGVRHVLSHRIIHADFYKLSLPSFPASLSGCLRVPIDGWRQYAMPRLIHAFLEENFL